MIRRLSVLLLLASLLGLVGASSASASPVEEAPPATIRVCRSSGGVDVVPFKDYVKAVLPIEFYPSWPTETLRAGAAVIKSYAWYFINHPISGECDLGDTTRHQVYAPERGRRTAATDQAVEDSWHLRMWDTAKDQIAFAQYCSGGCHSHARNAGAGRYMDQNKAHELGREGESSLEMLEWFYRNLPVDVTSWVEGLALDSDVSLLSLQSPGTVEAQLAGVPAGDPRVQVTATAVCTIGGEPTARLLQVVATQQDSAGATVATFDGIEGLGACEDDEAALHLQLVVNGHAAVTQVIPAWRAWSSATSRNVRRLAAADDPVLAAVALSQTTFASREPEPPSQSLLGAVVDQLSGEDEDEDDTPTNLADLAVLAGSTSFADALTAVALAGMQGPLLLHPSQEGLLAAVADELVRTLEPGALVHLVGGLGALPAKVASDIEELGFTVARTSGEDRTSTSVAVAQRVAQDGGRSMALLVRAWPDGPAGWADAVSAAPWAARTGTPILLTDPDELSPAVAAWLRDDANGIDEVLVIGGTSAISQAVVDELAGVRVTRIAGTRRDATALAVADQLWGSRGSPAPAAAIAQNVFDARGWPFAVVGSVVAARRDAAAVAVWSLVPPSTTGRWLDGKPSLPVLVVGGTSIVTTEVETALSGA